MFLRIVLSCTVLVTVFSSVKTIDRAQIVTECAASTGLKQDDFDKWTKNQQNPTEEMMCFMKCCHEKDGSLDENGKWNAELLNEHLNEIYLVNSSLKTQMMDCFTKSPPIKECADMKAATACIPQIESRNCTAENNLREDDFLEFAKHSKNPSEKMLCFFKCTAENDDLLLADGNLNLEFIKDLLRQAEDVEQEEKAKIEGCLANVPPVKSCSDILPFAQCVAHLKMF